MLYDRFRYERWWSSARVKEMIEVEGLGDRTSELFECWAPLGPHMRNGCATQKGNRAKPQRSGSRTLRPAALFLATALAGLLRSWMRLPAASFYSPSSKAPQSSLRTQSLVSPHCSTVVHSFTRIAGCDGDSKGTASALPQLSSSR
jgi:hypothetical protein